MKTNMSILLLLTCVFLVSCNEKSQEIYPVNVETTTLQYPDSCIRFPDLKQDVDLPVISYIINSQEELDLYLLGCVEYPSIDFGKYTLMLLFTKTEYVACALVQTAENKYRMDITFETSSSFLLPGVRSRHAAMILTPKMQEKPEFNLIFQQTAGDGDTGTYPKNIKTTALQYPDSCIKYPDLQAGAYLPVVSYILNSQEELDLHLLGCEEKCPSVDFDKQTLVLVFTKTEFDLAYQLVQTGEDKYRMDIRFELPFGMTVPSKELWYGWSRHATMILVPKMQKNPEFNLIFEKTEGGGYKEGYPKNIETTDFHISQDCLNITYFWDLSSRLYFYFRNSQESIDKLWVSGCGEEFPSIDFDKYTVLIMATYGCYSSAAYQLVQTDENKYRMDVIFGANSLNKKLFPITVLVPKIQEKPEVNFIVLSNY